MSSCKYCKGVGYIVENGKISDCICFIEKRNRYRLQVSGVPLNVDGDLNQFFLDRDADNNKLREADRKKKQEAKDIIEHYINKLSDIVHNNVVFSYIDNKNRELRGNNLLIYGGTRSGKTLLSVAIAKKAIVDLKILTYYIDWAKIIMAIMDQDSYNYKNLCSIFNKVKLLIIENIDSSMLPSEKFRYKLDNLFLSRYHNMSPTIFTSFDRDINYDFIGNVLSSMIKEAIRVDLPSTL